jgi:hypothetical protein
VVTLDEVDRNAKLTAAIHLLTVELDDGSVGFNGVKQITGDDSWDVQFNGGT